MELGSAPDEGTVRVAARHEILHTEMVGGPRLGSDFDIPPGVTREEAQVKVGMLGTGMVGRSRGG
jgi:hypothetical protein